MGMGFDVDAGVGVDFGTSIIPALYSSKPSSSVVVVVAVDVAVGYRNSCFPHSHRRHTGRVLHL